jgi:hypothetical protein
MQGAVHLLVEKNGRGQRHMTTNRKIIDQTKINNNNLRIIIYSLHAMPLTGCNPFSILSFLSHYFLLSTMSLESKSTGSMGFSLCNNSCVLRLDDA